MESFTRSFLSSVAPQRHRLLGEGVSPTKECTEPAAGRTRSIAGMTSGGPIDFVLFDLGGVLIDPGGVGPMRELSGLRSEDEVWARWLSCRWVRSFEAGRCSPEEFAAGLVDDWELELEPAAFLDEFARWPGPPYAGCPGPGVRGARAGPRGLPFEHQRPAVERQLRDVTGRRSLRLPLLVLRAGSGQAGPRDLRRGRRRAARVA